DGSITYAILPLAITMKGVREGTLHALGITGDKRSQELPEVPTIAEAGLAGFKATVWWGIWAPAGIPAGIRDRIAKDVTRALAAPDMIEQFKKSSFEPLGMTQAEFTKFVRGEMESAARTAKAAGIKPQ
ncbi:MAG: tripartite tricarboxylate transporter substrate-binding protein, partial [Nitrospirota bacterium]